MAGGALVAAARRAPQPLQKVDPAGASCPQLGQLMPSLYPEDSGPQPGTYAIL